MLTRSGAVAAWAAQLDVPLVVELRCSGSLSAEQYARLLAQRRGHVVVEEEKEEGADEVRGWLEGVVYEMMHGKGPPPQP